jgi:hypothetical protein
MRLTKRSSGLLAVGLLFAAITPTPARADVMLPVSYAVTSIAYQCDPYLLSNCSVGSNAVTLFNNGGSLTFQATPFSGSFVASISPAVTFPFVTFYSTLNGPFATLPTGASNEAVFTFTVFFNFTTPDGTQANSFTGGFYPDPGRATGHIAIQGAIFSPPSGSLPTGYALAAAVTSPPNIPIGAAANNSVTVSGYAAIAPEPSTAVLSASGLGILGLFALRRKRRSA